MKEYIEKLRDVLYRFRGLYCQNIDLSTIDEFLEASPSIDLSGQAGVSKPVEDLLKECRDLLVMCTLLDKSGQCKELVDKIDKHHE